MEMYQVYVCECCGKESLSHDTIEECEASHMGLTVAEKRAWDALKSAAKHFGSVVSTTNNERTRAAYDNAIKRLISFEQLHGISKN
ncbi:hypothetical protein [Bacteroides acidifaciens]|uniref:hypothetical protein n=1 Tax=Bacteroides acidifaciens TaxID=85831 RepID=UPI00248C074A|nr:hypothetical protein [Bacteroides acidifaciens]